MVTQLTNFENKYLNNDGSIKNACIQPFSIVTLPSGIGIPPAGLSPGSYWIDTTLGKHQGVIKVY